MLSDLIFGDAFAIVGLYIVVLSTYTLNTCYHINIKLVTVHVTSGVAHLAIFIKYCLLIAIDGTIKNSMV
jgi:hypothetical protein